MSFLKFALKLVILLSCLQAFAEDINILEPSDLPKTTERSYRAEGRGTMPDIERDFGIKEALKNKNAELDCKAPVGQQLTEWKVEISHKAIYWFYTISATFECLPPVVSTILDNSAAIELDEALKGITSTPINGVLHKEAKVLCYDFLEDKCAGGVIRGFFNHNVCELTNLNAPEKIIKIEDIALDDEVLQDHGATKLTNLLPVFIDNRRDDTPGGNCQPHVYGQLKGLERQAATVSCLTVGKNETCKIDGLINTKKD